MPNSGVERSSKDFQAAQHPQMRAVRARVKSCSESPARPAIPHDADDELKLGHDLNADPASHVWAILGIFYKQGYHMDILGDVATSVAFEAVLIPPMLQKFVVL